jgi:hypothetical protein
MYLNYQATHTTAPLVSFNLKKELLVCGLKTYYSCLKTYHSYCSRYAAKTKNDKPVGTRSEAGEKPVRTRNLQEKKGKEERKGGTSSREEFAVTRVKVAARLAPPPCYLRLD